MPDDKKGPAADHQHRKKIASDSPADVWPGGRQRRSAFVLWGPGGIGPLLSRLRREYRGDNDLGNPLTGDELAGLLDHFKDEPIPSALRVILQHELRGKRKKKPGPKPVRTAVDHIEDTLFPLYYTKGLFIGAKLRTWLKQRQKKQRRNARPYNIPTARHYACHHVRKWLPKFRDMTDASISNLLSKHPDKPRQRQRKRPINGG
jgi:hypothetical protein